MNTEDAAALAYRKKHFAIEVGPAKYPQEPDEVYLSFTTNGKQWQGISLLRSEAKQIIETLTGYFAR